MKDHKGICSKQVDEDQSDLSKKEMQSLLFQVFLEYSLTEYYIEVSPEEREAKKKLFEWFENLIKD